jgi:hypothetical protein
MRLRVSVSLLLLFACLGAAVAQPPTPEEFLGHRVGADRKLASYPRVLEYLRLVADASDRVTIEAAGMSTLGNEMVTVVLTSPSNQQNLDRYREISRLLANPDRLTDGEARDLLDEAKTISLVTTTIHSTEVGATQMAMEFVHDFATTQDPERLGWMEDVILLLMPSINPDGQVMIVDWYNKQLGTDYEGGRMPWLYQHYVGHDNNRDFYMLTQKETQVVNDLLYHRWFPHVFVDEHQMGSTGARMFVPPQTDPLALEVNSLIFRQADLIGTNMSFRLEEAGKTGVGHNMIFDSYWPGGTRNTAWWKNVTGLLTEVASARLATPIYIDPGELRGGSKGFPEYKRRANFPSPWPGGWWRLRDIVEYELIATWALVESSSLYRDELTRNFLRMSREAIAAGKEESPSGWIVSPDQHDPVAAGKLVDLLLEHGVRVMRTEVETTVGRTTYPAGTHVIPAAQPYRAFLLTMLRPQRYPEIRPHVDGPIIAPYDITAWSLPILMGVEVEEIDRPLPEGLARIEQATWPSAGVDADAQPAAGYLISHSADSAFTAMNRLLADGHNVHWLTEEIEGGAIGDIFVPAEGLAAEAMSALADELHLPVRALAAAPAVERLTASAAKIGLFKPWVASMDEGWTRFLLENYEFPHVNLNNDDLKAGKVPAEIDVLLFPDVSASIIKDGKPTGRQARFFSPLPPEYSGGISEEGGNGIVEFVRSGGTVVGLDSSTEYLINLFELPVRNVLDEVSREEFDCPGSMLRILVDTEHPLGYGLRPEEAAYFGRSPAFRTSLPDARLDRRVIARYPDHRDDMLVSGYLKGGQHLERRAAMVEFQIGEGRVILIGFRAQHRAQPHRTFKLLFNSLYQLD